jgi:hypothetical protein
VVLARSCCSASRCRGRGRWSSASIEGTWTTRHPPRSPCGARISLGNHWRTSKPSLWARRVRRLTAIEEESTPWVVIPCAGNKRYTQKPSRPAAEPRTTGWCPGDHRGVWRGPPRGASAPGDARCYSVREAADHGPWGNRAPRSLHSVQRQETIEAHLCARRYNARAGALWASWAFSAMVIRVTGREKERTNSGPLRKSTRKHSIYPSYSIPSPIMKS